MSMGTEGIVVATASAEADTIQALRASGVIVQVGREAFRNIVARQKEALVVHATGGLLRTNYQYLTSYKGLAFFACLSAPLDFPADTEIVLAKRIWAPD